MAARKGKNSIQELAAKAIEEVKRGPGRPKGSKGRRKASKTGRSCDPLAEVKRAAELVRRTKAVVSGLDVGSRSSYTVKKRGRPKKK